jgi:hypothetical protein
MALNDFRSAYMPYCLKKQSDDSYVVLNREYKPLGFITSEWINYEDYPVCVKIKGIGSEMAKELSCHGSEDISEIFLYHDGCNPVNSEKYMAIFLKKCGLLAKLQIE